jgi:hypothetical protein
MFSATDVKYVILKYGFLFEKIFMNHMQRGDGVKKGRGRS